MFGVQNICALTGDDVTAGDEPEARRVYDLDGPQLIKVATDHGRRGCTCPAGDDRPRRTCSSVPSRTPPPRRWSTAPSGR